MGNSTWSSIDPARACKDPEPRYISVFRGLWSDEALHRLRVDPRVIALFDRIFGERTLPHPMFVLRNIFPQSDGFDFTTGIHQDRVHIGGATSYAMWMPLGDCPREMGSLAVAEPQDGGFALLTVTHDQLESSPKTAESVSGAGWMLVLSGVKTLLETGKPLAG